MISWKPIQLINYYRTLIMSLLRISLVCLSLAVATISFAGDAPELPLTEETAAEHIKQKTNGKILSVATKQKDGKTIFRVKVLHQDDKIKIYPLDAETGQKP